MKGIIFYLDISQFAYPAPTTMEGEAVLDPAHRGGFLLLKADLAADWSVFKIEELFSADI
jgi:hypothetical protein